jgi:C4-dicarboxylate-specific signal transduction histidine kinase
MNTPNQAHILIVDDTPQNLVALEAVLKELNQHLIFAQSAKEALRLVLQYDFAVILLDVNMPDINGFETARLIRSREKSSYTPIIFLSALHKEEMDVNQGYAMGAVDYIFKPINPIILRSKVQVFIDLFTKSTLAIKLQQELEQRRRIEQRARRQQYQLQLAEQDRLSAMEEMTSALAHELNQPLTAIANYVQGSTHLLNNDNYEKEKLIYALQRAGQQAERAGAILHRIKNFVRKNKLYYEPVNLNDLILNIVSLLQEMVQETNIQLRLDLAKTIPSGILLDKIQIEQVFLNILRNGIEALQNSDKSQREILIQSEHNKVNKNIVIHIKDNGSGIAAENLDHLFDLYFTTKAHGMGIGLSICRTIIEAHSGNIHAQNNPDGGAWFQITLPLNVQTNRVDKNGKTSEHPPAPTLPPLSRGEGESVV